MAVDDEDIISPRQMMSDRHQQLVSFLLEVFSRMRSEGFSFNSWGSGGRALFATRCFYVRNRPQPSATVRNRPQPSATVRNRSQPFAVER